MSLIDLIKEEVVARALDELIIHPPKVPNRLVVPPARNSGGLVGRAFNYALGFEIVRQNPVATWGEWGADRSLRSLSSSLAGVKNLVGVDLEVAQVSANGVRLDVQDVDTWTKIIGSARRDLVGYAKLKEPIQEERAAMAQHALRLAKIEAYFRSGMIDPTVNDTRSDDVNDITALVAAVPRGFCSSPEVATIGPEFGDASRAVGGADADLILDDAIVELKTVKTLQVRQDVRQVVAYLVLAQVGQIEGRPPSCQRAVLYYARQAQVIELALMDDFKQKTKLVFEIMQSAATTVE